ncbi:hypothetical protein ACO7_470047 [Thiomonas arsenitoxydans]|nr:hypothetical protein ACO7_470047 [Thiomonas arsenitoxydans]
MRKRLKRASGAGSGTRTRTLLRALDFESSASTDSAIPAGRSGIRAFVPDGKQNGESKSPVSTFCNFGAQKRTRTSTPRSAST